MENSNQEGSFAGFCTALILSIVILIYNHDINSLFFISISIISIFLKIKLIYFIINLGGILIGNKRSGEFKGSTCL